METSSSFFASSTTMLVARTNSSSTSLALTYPVPSTVAMEARRFGQSFMTYPMPLQRWHTILLELFDDAPGAIAFFCGWDCTGDKLLTSEVCVVADGVAGGWATEALGLSTLERCCRKDLPRLDLKVCC
ncbi:hypothetical protein SEVIR_2G166750v4 [Setaria viridis]